MSGKERGEASRPSGRGAPPGPSWLRNPLLVVVILALVLGFGGGYLIGFLVAFFERNQSLPIEWRLLAITGFLGGLTTFSTFSAESMILLQRGQFLWAFGHSALHLLGSVAFCFAGFATYRALFT